MSSNGGAQPLFKHSFSVITSTLHFETNKNDYSLKFTIKNNVHEHNIACTE